MSYFFIISFLYIFILGLQNSTRYFYMDGYMDGWVDGYMDGWVDGWVDGWLNGFMAGWMDGRYIM